MADAIVQNVLARASEEEAEQIKSLQVDKLVELEFDLGNLLAYDSNEIDLQQLRSDDKESYLRSLARGDVQLLIGRLFELPTDKVENDIVVKLPEPSTRLPREKPVPKPRAPTKWEKYAKEKGITSRKKASSVWDEELKKWVPRYGYRKALAEKEKNWVVELSAADKDTDDPIAKRQKQKQETVAKNELQRLRNVSKRMQKSKAKSKISLEPTERPTVDQLNRSVFVAHTATASLGKFQPNLPEQKPILKSGQKRKFQPLVGDMKAETQKSLDILEKMKAKKPLLDIEKAVNREMNRPGGGVSAKSGSSLDKKSKTQLKKNVGKKKHPKGNKNMTGKKGNVKASRGKKQASGKASSKGSKGKGKR